MGKALLSQEKVCDLEVAGSCMGKVIKLIKNAAERATQFSSRVFL